MIKWEDPNVWASWTICRWTPDQADHWACLLPAGHSGPHVAPLNMENDPRDAEWVAVDGNWQDPEPCGVCGAPHPGFRHATRNDPVVIDWHFNEDAWGPGQNPEFPDGQDGTLLNLFVPTFVDTFPKPPKFDTLEEAEAWLEANPPS